MSDSNKKWLAVLFIAMCTTQAYATLGANFHSVAKDKRVMRGRADRSVKHADFSVEQMAVGRTVVRQYVSPKGTVFGVTWTGMARPNLKQLLGDYHAEYEAQFAKRNRAGGSRQRTIKGENIIVEQGGHFNHLQGRAYVPALVPAGVNLREIR